MRIPAGSSAGPIACVYNTSLPNTVAVYRTEASPATNVPVVTAALEGA